jgi:hypothetical protein
MSWQEFLNYALTPAGIGAITGLVLSWIVEYWPAYGELEAKFKRLVFLALCFVVPLAATAGLVASGFTGPWGDFQNVWWPALVAGFTAFTSGQVSHLRKL